MIQSWFSKSKLTLTGTLPVKALPIWSLTCKSNETVSPADPEHNPVPDTILLLAFANSCAVIVAGDPVMSVVVPAS